MSDQIQPLNYSAHAIEDLLRTVADFQNMGALQSARVLRGVIDLLRTSVNLSCRTVATLSIQKICGRYSAEDSA